MNSKQMAISVLIMLLLASLMVILLTNPLAAGTLGQEANLNPLGEVHELFRDDQGILWISDYLAAEIWRVDPAGGAYTIYGNLDGASDGRVDSNGHLWWSDFDGNALGRLIPGASQATIWSLPGFGGPLGIAFDDAGQVWIADVFETNLYRFDPASTELCIYNLPDGGSADYVLYEAGHIWFGDTVLGRIGYFNPSDGTFSVWQLLEGSIPQGLALDPAGQIWWADLGLGALGRIDTQGNQVTYFAVPPTDEVIAEPVGIAIDGGEIWYTNYSGSFGLLDPTSAEGDTSLLLPANSLGSPDCSILGNGTAVDISEKSGSLTWENAAYNRVVNEGGWQIYDLPEGAAPWGIAVNSGNVWFNDQGTADLREPKLGWMVLTNPKVFLPAIIGD